MAVEHGVDPTVIVDGDPVLGDAVVAYAAHKAERTLAARAAQDEQATRLRLRRMLD